MYNQNSEMPKFRPIPPTPLPLPSPSSSSSFSSSSSSSSSSSEPFISPIQPHYAMVRPHQYSFPYPRVQTQPPLGFRPSPPHLLGLQETVNVPHHPLSETLGLKGTPNIPTHHHPSSETLTLRPVPPPSASANILGVPPVPRPLHSSFPQPSISSQWVAQAHFRPFPHPQGHPNLPPHGHPFPSPNVHPNPLPHGYSFMSPPPGPFHSSSFHPPLPISLPSDNHELPPPPPSSPPPPPPSTNEESSSIPDNSNPDPPAPPRPNNSDVHVLEPSLVSSKSNVCPPEPPRPNDLEMLKNIDVLAAFVAKNGPRFESMARARQAGDPKFAFLFESDSTPEASIGHGYYKWRKQVLALEVEKGSIKDGYSEMYGSVPDSNVAIGQPRLHDESHGSPTMSDMDMEDDFLPTSSVQNEQSKSISQEVGDSKGEARDSKAEVEDSEGEARDSKVEVGDCRASSVIFQNSQLNTGPSEIESFSGVSQYKSLFDSYSKRCNIVRDNDNERQNLMSTPHSESQKEISLSNSVNRKNPRSKTDDNGYRKNQRSKTDDNGSSVDMVDDRDKFHSKWKQSDDTISRSTKHHNIEEEAHPKNVSSAMLLGRTSDYLFPGSERTEQDFQTDARTPYDCEEKIAKSLPRPVKQALPTIESDSSQGIKISHYSEHDTGQGSRNAEVHTQKRSATNAERHETKDVALDNFGRVIRKGAEESVSDEEQCRKKRRRSYSRSRSSSRSISRSPSEQSRRNVSRSPSSERWKRRRSFSRSPVRRGRRSRSWSRSPPRRRSNYSRSPSREAKWRAEEDRRNDHDLYGRGRRDGRKSGHNVSFNYARGWNVRRFSHQDRETVKERDMPYVKDDEEHSLRNDDVGHEPYGLDQQQLPHFSADYQVDSIIWNKGDRGSGSHDRERNSHLKSHHNDVRNRPTEKASNILKNLNAAPTVSDHEAVEGMNFKAIGIPDESGGKTRDVDGRDLNVEVTTGPKLSLESKFSERNDQDGQLNSHIKVNEVNKSPTAGSQGSLSGHQHIQNEQTHKTTLSYQHQHAMRPGNMPLNQVSPLKPPNINAFTNSSNFSPGIFNPPQLLTSQEHRFMDMNAVPSQSVSGNHTNFASAPMHRPLYPSHLPPHGTSSYLSSVLSQPGFTQGIHQQSALPNLDMQNYALHYPEKNSESGQHGFTVNVSLLREDSNHRPFASDTSKQFITPNSVKSSQNTFSRPSIMPSSSGSYSSVAAEQPSAYSYSLTTIPPLNLPSGLEMSTLCEPHDPSSDAPAPGTSCSMKEISNKNPTVSVVVVENASPAINSDKSNQFTKKLEADAPRDVGIVENVSPPAGDWSPGGRAEAGNDEAKPQSKKSIRGLKLLRSAVADQVKLLLKPTWREGHMSKDAYKTIVKKAVEKVTGNMPSHHIPKSQEKIDQFMSVSNPKISKLVKGYVDKYLKL